MPPITKYTISVIISQEENTCNGYWFEDNYEIMVLVSTQNSFRYIMSWNRSPELVQQDFRPRKPETEGVTDRFPTAWKGNEISCWRRDIQCNFRTKMAIPISYDLGHSSCLRHASFVFITFRPHSIRVEALRPETATIKYRVETPEATDSGPVICTAHDFSMFTQHWLADRRWTARNLRTRCLENSVWPSNYQARVGVQCPDSWASRPHDFQPRNTKTLFHIIFLFSAVSENILHVFNYTTIIKINYFSFR